MNAYYAVVPGVLLSIFFGYERHVQRERDTREQIRAEKVAAERAAQDAAREQQIRIAAADVERRNTEREQQERDRADQKRRAYETLMATLQSETDDQARQLTELRIKASDLSIQLRELRTRQATLDNEAHETVRKLEGTEKLRRRAELSAQQKETLIAARLDEQIARALVVSP